MLSLMGKLLKYYLGYKSWNTNYRDEISVGDIAILMASLSGMPCLINSHMLLPRQSVALVLMQTVISIFKC